MNEEPLENRLDNIRRESIKTSIKLSELSVEQLQCLLDRILQQKDINQDAVKVIEEEIKLRESK